MLSKWKIWLGTLKNRIRTIHPKVRYSYVEKHNKKYLILSIWKYGKPIWSKHFIIAAVDFDEGIKNDYYDKGVDEFFKSSSK